ncbi:LOW QUALITY PROTEIN: Zinc finger, C2H2-like [Aspergillus lentulus]|nr:LOW QUALITY PROTEIN: Zinc finger, C2H2-like [Aspergillus lentulus]
MLMTQLWCRDFHKYQGQPADQTCADQYSNTALLLHLYQDRRSPMSRPRDELGLERAREMSPMRNWKLNLLQAFVITIKHGEGEPILILTYQQEFTMGHWRKKEWELPIHRFYKIYKDDVPLFFNLLTFFLPLASANHAFHDY